MYKLKFHLMKIRLHTLCNSKLISIIIIYGQFDSSVIIEDPLFNN